MQTLKQALRAYVTELSALATAPLSHGRLARMQTVVQHLGDVL
jgi:hypothetical protein